MKKLKSIRTKKIFENLMLYLLCLDFRSVLLFCFCIIVFSFQIGANEDILCNAILFILTTIIIYVIAKLLSFVLCYKNDNKRETNPFVIKLKKCMNSHKKQSQLRLSKDIFYYIFIHFICADIGGILLFSIITAFLYLLLPENINIILVMNVFIAIVLFFKLMALIIYYKNDYKRVQDPYLINFIETLKSNKKHSRLIFILIVTFIYNIRTLSNTLMHLHWHFWEPLIEGTCLMYFFSALVPYKILFYYWDAIVYKKEKNPSLIDLLKFILKKSYKFILITLFILISAELISISR